MLEGPDVSVQQTERMVGNCDSRVGRTAGGRHLRWETHSNGPDEAGTTEGVAETNNPGGGFGVSGGGGGPCGSIFDRHQDCRTSSRVGIRIRATVRGDEVGRAGRARGT